MWGDRGATALLQTFAHRTLSRRDRSILRSVTGGIVIYLDHAATTPLHPGVLDAMLPYLRERFGNASSPHSRGRAASAAVNTAREQVAELVGAAAANVVFTSGSTEALNTALKGMAARRPAGRDVLIVSAIEHKAVLDTAEYLTDTNGVEVITVAPTRDGEVTPDAVAEALERVADRTFAAAVMAVNNETGVIQDSLGIAELLAERGIPYVCDATQAAGWNLVNHAALPGATFLTVSAHKLHGPQGVGALVLPSKTARPNFDPLIHGGGHERGLRSGTVNLAGNVGFGHAAALARSRDHDGVVALRDLTVNTLGDLAEAIPTIEAASIAPHIMSLWIPNVDADALIVNCPDVAFASGSACTSAVPSPSHVLRAMGLPTERAEQTIRLSISHETTPSEVQQAIGAITRAAERIRAVQGVA